MSDYRRQHPLMILFTFVNHVKSLVVPFLIGFVIQLFSGEREEGSLIYLGIVGGILILTLIFNSLGWIFYRYKLEEDALQIKSGVIIKHRRHIKRARVQTTNLEAGLLHRLFHLYQVRIETAGSKTESEFTLAALKKADATRIQTFLETNIREPGTTPPQMQWLLSGKDLFLAGVSSGGIGFVFSVIGFIATQAFIFLPEAWLDTFYDSVFAMSIALIFLLVIVLLFVSWVISVVRYFIRFAFFTVEKLDDELIITRGLIVKRILRLKQHRIQALSVVEGLLREPFHFATIELEVAGGVEYETNFTVTLCPLIHRRLLHGFIQKFLPDYAVHFQLQPLPKRALKRYLFRATLLIVPLVPLFFVWPLTRWALLLLPLHWLLAVLRYKNGGVCLLEDQLVLRHRLVAKKTIIAARKHIQDVTLRQTILQRLWQLGTVTFTVMSSPEHATFALKDVESSVFQDLYGWYLQ